MTDHTALLEAVRAADPWPTDRRIPVDLLAIQTEPSVEILDVPSNGASLGRGPVGLRRGLVVAMGSAAAVLVLIVGASLLFGGADGPAEAPMPSDTSSTVATTTTPTTSTIPSASFDAEALASVPEPRTQDDVNVVFLAMPSELLGMTASRDDPDHVGFVDYSGESGFASIAWIEAGPHREAVIEFLDGIRGIPEFTETSSSPRMDGPFIWLEGEAAEQFGDIYLLWWGNPDDGWIFSVEASSPEVRTAVVEAFVVAASPPADGAEDVIDTATDRSELPLAAPWDVAWIGELFTAAANMTLGEDQFTITDEWNAHPDALANVGNMTVQILIDDQPSGLWPWDSGTGRPTGQLLIVGREPSPYMIGEFEIEILGHEPAPPDASVTHELALWSVAEVSTGTYVILDVAPITRTGENMGYGALVTLWQEFDLCRVDQSVEGAVYAWFDVEDPEMEVFYRASKAVAVVNDGTIQEVNPELVECIVQVDWETRGY